MSNRRPLTLLISFAVVGILGFALAAILDEQKGWNHPGQAVANVSWITMLVCVVGLVATGATLLSQRLRRHTAR